MNNNEAIDNAIALLEKLRTPSKPRERWTIMDRDGDLGALSDSRESAECQLDDRRRNGAFAPYSLVRIVEVIE